MIRRLKAIIIFDDNTGYVAEYSLKYNLPFSKKEMEKWVKEQSVKRIKEFHILSTE